MEHAQTLGAQRARERNRQPAPIAHSPATETIRLADPEGRMVDVEVAWRQETSGGAGSVLYELHIPRPPDGILELDWNRLGKRVCIDVARGHVSYVVPGSDHECHAWAINNLIQYYAEYLGLDASGLLGTRWQAPGKGMEADASYYIGEKVGLFRAAKQAGKGEDFTKRMPPDLVVEVDVSSENKGKAKMYRRQGTLEMWRLDAVQGGKLKAVRILDLQADGGVRDMHESRVLPGLDRELVARAARLGFLERHDQMKELLGNAAAKQAEKEGSIYDMPDPFAPPDPFRR